MKYKVRNFILVPSLQVAQLNEYEQKLLVLPTNKMTLETYLNITKQSLKQISGHPVRKIFTDSFCTNRFDCYSILQIFVKMIIIFVRYLFNHVVIQFMLIVFHRILKHYIRLVSFLLKFEDIKTVN
jgi:hypothetical protein